MLLLSLELTASTALRCHLAAPEASPILFWRKRAYACGAERAMSFRARACGEILQGKGVPFRGSRGGEKGLWGGCGVAQQRGGGPWRPRGAMGAAACGRGGAVRGGRVWTAPAFPHKENGEEESACA